MVAGGPSRAHAVSVDRDGADATIAAEDSGPGVAPGIRDQIFKALATTKRDGLGLGLSKSRSIVQARGSGIRVEPSTLGGARFVATFPLEKS